MLALLAIYRVHARIEGGVRRVLREIEDAARVDEAGERPDREGPATEPEQEDPVARRIDARELAVELLDVAAEPPAGRAGQQAEPLHRLRPDAVVIQGHLRRQPGRDPVAHLIDRFVELEDVGAAALDGRVASAVGADDDA